MEQEDIYRELIRNARELKENEEIEASGIDDFLKGDKIKLASLDDLSGFFRISADTLVHKAEKDLWAIKENKGSFVIERLFDPDTKEALRI